MSVARSICYHAGWTAGGLGQVGWARKPDDAARIRPRTEGGPVTGILDRLAQNARAQIHAFLQRHVITAPAARRRHDADDGPQEPHRDEAAGPGESPGPLPYNAELAEAYRVLDLPFGAPMGKVNKRWKAYLKRCHPDRYHSDPGRQADATELSQQLNAAHARIEDAWKNASRTD